MGYEQSKFGDGSAAGSGNVVSTVSNHYGPRDVGKMTGGNKTEGAVQELAFDIDGTIVGNDAWPLKAPELPANVLITGAYVEVTEAFALGGTSPTIDIGTEGSEGTNRVEITEAQAEAVGVYDLTSTLAGTWAAGLTAATTVGIDLGGTSPTVTSAGKARVVLRYVRA